MKDKSYYLLVEGVVEDGGNTAFFKTKGKDCAMNLCKLFNMEYGGKDSNLSFNCALADQFEPQIQKQLDEYLGILENCDDPDSNVNDPKPSEETMTLAHYAFLAWNWETLLRRYHLSNLDKEGKEPPTVLELDEIASYRFKTDNCNYQCFSEAITLATYGKEAIYALIEPFKESLSKAGFKIPAINIDDAKFFDQVSCILQAENRIPPKLKAQVEYALQWFKSKCERYNKFVTERTKNHKNRETVQLRLMKIETGEHLLTIVEGCICKHVVKPDKLTQNQSKLIGRLLDYAGDHELVYQAISESDKVEFGLEMTEQLNELAGSGLSLFAGSIKTEIDFDDGKPISGTKVVLQFVPNEYQLIHQLPDGRRYIDVVLSNNKNQTVSVNQNSQICQEVHDNISELHREIDGVKARFDTLAEQPTNVTPLSESESKRILSFFERFRMKKPLKAPLLKVLDCILFQGLSGKQTARECRCKPSLITLRKKEILRELGFSNEQFKAYSSQIYEIRRAYNAEKVRKEQEE